MDRSLGLQLAGSMVVTSSGLVPWCTNRTGRTGARGARRCRDTPTIAPNRAKGP